MFIPETIPQKPLFSTKDIAILFHTSKGAVSAWIKFGSLAAEKYEPGTVRIPRSSITEFIKNRKDGVIRRSKKGTKERILANMRRRLNRILKGKIKSDCTKKLLGCTFEAFIVHIERQFQPGMTWENYGNKGWTIDHIIPCAQFDFSIPEHQKICFHYINLQPLWKKDNSSKRQKITRRSVGDYFANFHKFS